MEWIYVGGDGDGVKNCWGKRRGGRREREKRLGEGEGDCEGCGIGDTEAGAKGGCLAEQFWARLWGDHYHSLQGEWDSGLRSG